jgi:hypothetical protein
VAQYKKSRWSSSKPDSGNSFLEDYEAIKRANEAEAKAAPAVAQEIQVPAQSATIIRMAFMRRKAQVRPSQRPVTTAKGKPINPELYWVGIQKCDLAWLNKQAGLRNITISRMLVRVGLGQDSLPWHHLPKVKATDPIQDDVSKIRKDRMWATVCITIHEDDWDDLVRNEAAAIWPDDRPAPSGPDPAAFCVLVALGVVRTPSLATVLMDDAKSMLLLNLNRAMRVAHTWNPWLLPLPPKSRLIEAVAAVQRRLQRNNFGRGDAFECEMIFSTVEKLRAFADKHGMIAKNREWIGADSSWDMLVKMVQHIAKDTKE